MSNALFPGAAIQEIFGIPLLFLRHATPANVAAQTSSQKTLEQRVQPVFLTPAIAGYRYEDIAPDKIGKDSCAVHAFKKGGTCVQLDAVQQGDFQQQSLNLFRFVGKHFFGKVVEDVPLRLS